MRLLFLFFAWFYAALSLGSLTWAVMSFDWSVAGYGLTLSTIFACVSFIFYCTMRAIPK